MALVFQGRDLNPNYCKQKENLSAHFSEKSRGLVKKNPEKNSGLYSKTDVETFKQQNNNMIQFVFWKDWEWTGGASLGRQEIR